MALNSEQLALLCQLVGSEAKLFSIGRPMAFPSGEPYRNKGVAGGWRVAKLLFSKEAARSSGTITSVTISSQLERIASAQLAQFIPCNYQPTGFLHPRSLERQKQFVFCSLFPLDAFCRDTGQGCLRFARLDNQVENFCTLQ